MPLLVTLFVGVSLAGFASLFPERYCDFRAFYCSGQVVLSGQNPYLEHPLHECEQALPMRFLSSVPPGFTMPAPYPSYVLALFAVVARLPFDVAVIVWMLASCLALAIGTVLVARLTATPMAACVIALVFPAAIVALPLGQPTLFVLSAIAACAALLRADRPRLAALAALATAIDPQVGLALCVGVFAAVPRTRLTLLGGACLLVTLSTVGFGAAREWQYVHAVLPAHALANIPEFSQFSAANLAFSAGVAPRIALVIGGAWYGVSLLLGSIAGLRLQRRYGIAAAAFVPVAFAVFGGAHTHLQQLALATPAFLLITSAAGGRRRATLVVATFCATIPWLIAALFPYLFVATGVLGIAFARAMRTPHISRLLGAGSLVVLSLLCLLVLQAHAHAPAPALTYVVSGGGNPLAEVSWDTFVKATSLPAQTWYFVAKLPTLAGFAVLLTALLAEAWPESKAHSLGVGSGLALAGRAEA